MVDRALDDLAPCMACGQKNPLEAKFCGRCGASLETASLQPGDIIAGRYRVVKQIGQGAMGTVYRAEHVQISKSVAIKLLHHEAQQDAESVARFHREAEAASRLNHPNTVQVFDFGRTELGSLYLVMEYVPGDDLGKVLAKDGPMPFGRVAYLCAQVAGSVADAHAAGVIHRDLKPENVVIASGRDGDRPKVLDFGLAKLFAGKLGTPLTSSGTIVGTPYYMSPEQIQGKELDGRSDVYAIGAIMYECVVGKAPFDAPNPLGVLSKHLSEPPTPPSRRSPLSVPPEADEIIMRCLQKDPADRYPTAEALREALVDYLSSVGSSDWRFGMTAEAASNGGDRRAGRHDRSIQRRRRPWLWALLFGLVLGGLRIWHSAATQASESEPNHLSRNATRLPLDTPMEAYLGRRLSEAAGDVDLFELTHTGPARRAAEIEVTSIPNMDIVVELSTREGHRPLVVADSGALGEGERLPNIALDPGKYLIRVHERSSEGRLPTENVSDAYFVRWGLLDEDASFEREPNDSLELAELLALGTDRRAWIGWPGDVDTFCLSRDAERVIAQVSGLAEVDLVLRIVDRRSERSAKVDDKGIGRGETSTEWQSAEAGDLCLEVSADPTNPDSRRAQPDQTYGVRFIPAPGR